MAASTLSRLVGWRRLIATSVLAGVGLLVALVALLGGRSSVEDAQPSAAVVPVPIYEIEAVSNGHVARLLNLPLPYVGAPQTPIPVDINGDLLPDVTAAVNLVNAQGIFNNPPNTGELIAPNIEFLRLLTAPIITPGNLPLRINVKLTLIDPFLEDPNTVVRFGYDTGPGGAIPPKYKAVLGGLENGFNPLRARIDTVGGMLIGLDPRLPDLGLSPRSPAYSGPLTSFAALDTAPGESAKVDLRFGPMPDLVEVSYESQDDGTQQFTYAHSDTGEVDLDIIGHVESDGLVADANARLHRVPREVALGLRTAEGEGAITYESSSASGRLPDLSASVVLDDPELVRPLRARVDAESLPDNLSASWSLQPGEAPEVDFAGSGQGIGSIEARLQNYEDLPTAFTPWAPDEQQHINIQAGPGGVLVDDTLITARLERIRAASIHTTENGSIEGNVQVGDGERPLQVHGEIDLRQPPPPAEGEEPDDPGPYIEATATISPLPDNIDFIITPTAEIEGGPMRIVYHPSETIDVDTQAIVGLPNTTGPIERGDPDSLYADVAIRNVPTHIEARVYDLPGDTRIEVDAEPRVGATPLDVFAQATAGPLTELDPGEPLDALLAAPIHAEVNVQGLPRYLRVRALEDAAQDLSRVDVRTCDLDYETNTCAPGTDDEVAIMDFAVRNWDERPTEPADPVTLPAPPESGPVYLTVTARGLPDTNDLVYYEATGRMTDFRQATFLKTADLTAAKLDIGSGQDFRTWIDVEDIDTNGGDPGDGRVDLDGDIRVTPLPTPLNFCIAQPGRPIPADEDGMIDPDLTAACESLDPFGDGTAQTGPMTLAYLVGEAGAATAFDVVADIEARGDFPIEQPESEIDFGTFDRVASHLALTGIPGDFTAYIATPGESSFDLPGDSRASGTRVRTVAPGADNTNLDLGVELTTEGVDCADPDPDGVNGVAGAICGGITIEKLPEYASALFSTTTTTGASDDEAVEQRFEAYGCDFEFFAADPGCRDADPDDGIPEDTAGSIGVIAANFRAHAGQPDGIETFVAPEDQPHVVAQADLDDLSNFELEARLRVEDLRAVTYRQDPDRTEVTTDVGSGEPLTIHGHADLRDAEDVLDDEYRLEGIADVVVNPLPETFTFVQTGPGAQQTDPMHIEATASDDVEVTIEAELRSWEAGVDAPCGDPSTICAGLHIDKIPAEITADLVRTNGEIEDQERITGTELTLALDPHAPGDPKPTITAHAAVGLPSSVPVVGGLPLFADLLLQGVPLDMTVDLESREVITGSNEVRSSSLERFQFHACDMQDDGTCAPDTEDKIDLIEASVRTVDVRPTNFPSPPAAGPDVPASQIHLAGRGDAIEGYVRFPNISEVQYLNQNGVLAATARLGDGSTPSTDQLAINVDIQDLAVGASLPLGDVNYLDPLVDATTALTINPFPGDLSFCVREGGLDIEDTPVSGVDFAAACESANPFEISDPEDRPDETPLSIAFAADSTFTVDVEAEFAVDGHDASNQPLPTTRIRGDLNLGNVPQQLSFHFLQPSTEVVNTGSGFVVEPRGEYRARLRAPTPGTGLNVTFAGEHLIGSDTECEDPRPTVSATCATATLSNLPSVVDFVYDPDLEITDPSNLAGARNLFVFADNPATPGGSLTFDDLHFSRVKPRLNPDNTPVMPLDSDAIIADVDLGAFEYPLDVRGTIFVPEADGEMPIIDVERVGGNLLPEVSVGIRSYVAPNPFLDYDQRYSNPDGLPLPARAVPNNGGDVYELALLQRGNDMRLNATLPAVRRVSARAVLSTTLEPIGTFAVDVGFAQGFNVRAFLDMAPDQQTRIYADTRIDDIPSRMTLCFRNKRTTAQAAMTPFAGTATWCDSPQVRPDEGAFEFAQLNAPGSNNNNIDIDAFVRLQLGGGSTLISGRVDIDNVPHVVRGRLPGETLEVTTFNYNLAGQLMPFGIQRIAFEAATFDLPLDRVGYGAYTPAQLPYPFRPNTSLPALADPPPVSVHGDRPEFLHVSANVPTLAFHARGQLGRNDNQPSSQLQRLYYSSEPCVNPGRKPDPTILANSGAIVMVPDPTSGRYRPDFPHLPLNSTDGSNHKCIEGEFFAGGDGMNPLSLSADVDVDAETTIRMRQGGLNNIPGWFQMNLAEAEPFSDTVNDRGWRRPCGPATDGFHNCVAPLIRFDQPDAGTVLFGSAEVGARSDLNTALGVVPTTTNTPNFGATPTATGFDAPDDDRRGARVRLIDIPTGPNDRPYDSTRMAVAAAIRIPIPQSLTVDTPQSFDEDNVVRTPQDGHAVGGTEAHDMRFRVSIRDAAGNVVPAGNLGDAALYKARVNRTAEMLISEACAPTLIFNVWNALQRILPNSFVQAAQELFGFLLCPEWAEGIPLPGEMGITMYDRTQYTDMGGDKLRTSQLLQIDGRLSSSFNAAVRMREAGGTLPSLVASAYDVPAGFGAAEIADPGRPTFRLRAEIIGDDDKPKDAEPPQPNAKPKEDPVIGFNTTTEFSLGGVKADFDFNASGTPARLIDATIFTAVSDVTFGVDVRAYAGLDPSSGPAEIDAHVSAVVNRLMLEGFSKWNLPIDDIIEAVTDWIIHTFIGDDNWVSDALEWLFDTIAGGIDDLINGALNTLPVGFAIDGRINVDLDINNLNRFTYRSALLRAYTEAHGSGDATVGPLNLYLTRLSAGLYFDLPDIPLPTGLLNDLIDAFECVFSLFSDCESDERIPESIDLPEILLAGYGFIPTGLNPSFFIPVLLDFRTCNATGWSGPGGDFVDFLGSLVPFLGGGFDNAIEIDGGGADDAEDYAIWPGTDFRIGLTGIIPTLLAPVATLVVDFIIDIVAGPILCLGFDNGEDTVLDTEYSSDANTYNPGNTAASDDESSSDPSLRGFAYHGVPGQPGQDLTQFESIVPEGAPAPSAPPAPEESTPTPPPAPPTFTAPPPLYASPTGVPVDATIDGAGPIAMCGVHEYTTLVIETDIEVATAPNATIIEGRPACQNGNEGFLEFRANELALTSDGSIDASAIMNDVADLSHCPPATTYPPGLPDPDGDGLPTIDPDGPGGDPPFEAPEPIDCDPTDPAPFRATGNSGGTNAGSGYDGAAISAGVAPYTIDRADNDDYVTSGGPGAAIPDGYTRDGQTGPIEGDDGFGLGGGAIRLRADTSLVVDGPLTADGGDSEAGTLSGECDDDPDDNGVPGLQQHHVDDDNDPDTPSDNDTDDDNDDETPVDNDDADPDNPDEDTPVDNDVVDPPTAGEGYEHTGTMGAGGGAGGGILLQAREEIEVLDDADFSATGGDGGDGFLGAGGAGGGGVIRVNAPIVSGVAEPELDDATIAGINGEPNAGSATPPCDLVPMPTENTFDNPDTGAVETDPLPHNGFGEVYNPPYARLNPYGTDFWRQGGVDFTGYLTAGGSNEVFVQACAVHLPDNPADANSPIQIQNEAAALLPKVVTNPDGTTTPFGTLPNLANPCGTRGGTTIVEIGDTTFTGSVVPPSAASQVALNGATTGYYAMYATAISPSTPGNDCFDASDNVDLAVLGGTDATDCRVEALNGIDWVLGLDATAPDLPDGNVALSGSAVVTTGEVILDFNTTDAQSGVLRDAGSNLRGQCRIVHLFPGPATDPEFGNCTSSKPFPIAEGPGLKLIEVRVPDAVGNVSVVRSRAFIFNQGTPDSHAAPQGGSQTAGWYTSAPSILLNQYSSFTPPGDPEFAYQFDNGLEATCNDPTNDTTHPYDDTACTVPASSVNVLEPGAHEFYWSAIDSEGRRNAIDSDPATGPMEHFTLNWDNRGPLVEVTPVGLPDQMIGSTPWYSYRPRIFVSSIDQFGASGVGLIEYSFDGGATWPDFDPTNPPPLPVGVTQVCGRATDVAGNPSDSNSTLAGNQPACVTLNVDAEAPTLTFTPSAPTPASGWYTEAPSFTAANYVDQPVPGGVGAAEDRLRVRYDNAGHVDCDVAPCVVDGPASLGSGRHLVHASAADRFDNRSTETRDEPNPTSYEIFVDLEDPRVVPVIGPADPDGANGWWVSNPWLTLFGDDGDGSGIDALYYSLDGTIDGLPGAFTEWTEPVQTDAGDNELCWYGIDIAGRDSDVECQAMQVDLDDPTANASAPPGPFDGWHDGPVTATSTAGDTLPGSGIGPAGDQNQLCEDLAPETTPAPSGRCISVDGGPYVPIGGAVTGSVDLSEGDHQVRTFSIDESGRRSPVSEATVRIDMSRPVVAIRLLPPEPAQNDWYRYRPYVVLRASDGRDGSGIIPGSFQYQVDGGGLRPYIEPFQLQQGVHTVDYQASDLVGTRSGSQQVRVDTTSPRLQAGAPTQSIWIRLLGPSSIGLRYTVGDNLSGPIHTWVVISDVTGNPVRLIDGGVQNVAPGGSVTRTVQWDGKTGALTSLVPLGVYYYRVFGVDEAGNWTQSGESRPITIKLL